MSVNWGAAYELEQSDSLINKPVNICPLRMDINNCYFISQGDNDD